MRRFKQILIYILATLTLSCEASTVTQQKPPFLSLDSFFKPVTHSSLFSSSASYTISGTIADSINYIELYLATDNTCKTTCQSGSCNPQTYSTSITSGTEISYGTTVSGGTHYGIRDTSVAAFLHAAGLPSTSGGNHYFVGMYFKAKTAGNCSSAYCSAAYDAAGHNLCLQATFNSAGNGSVGDLQRTDNGNVLINTPTQYMYIPNSATGGNNIQRCLLNSDGTLGNCLATSTLNPTPLGMAFATVNGTQYGYMAIGQTSIYKCNLTSGGIGTLSCALMSPTGFGPDPEWNTPYTLSFATVGGTQYAYLVDNSPVTPTVYRCSVWSTATGLNGNFQLCTIASYFPHPTGLAFATIDGTQYAYVSDYDGHVYSCNETFSACQETSAPTGGPGSPTAWFAPNGIGVATVNNDGTITHYAYVLETLNNTIYQCTINSNGTLSSTCAPAIAKSNWSPAGISVGTVNGTQYAYISDAYAGVYQCTITNTGAFGACNLTPPTSAPTGWEARGNTALPIITQ